MERWGCCGHHQFNELQMALKQAWWTARKIHRGHLFEQDLRNSEVPGDDGHNYNTMVHVISKKVWDKLTLLNRPS